MRASLETSLNDLALHQKPVAEDTLETALAQIDQLVATFNALLRLARIESGAGKSAFKTGEGGYVEEVTYQPVNSSGARDGRQTSVGKEGIAGDVGGHIQACRHGGTCDRFNLFPQNSNFNNSAYKTWENEITRSLQNGDDVGNVTVRLNRADPHNPRPDSLEIEYEINGRTFTRDFENQAGGGQ